MSRRVIHVIGAAATGKSMVAAALSAALDIPAFGPDQVRETRMIEGGPWLSRDAVWARLRELVRGEEACILESAGVLIPLERTAIGDAATFRIRCVASRASRAARLRARVRDGYMLAMDRHGRPRTGYVDQLLYQVAPTGAVDVEIDTSEDPPLTGIVQRVRSWMATPLAGVA